jgi:hypothetical protein
MPSISITDADFSTLACAAQDAQDRGDEAAAKALDRLARKMNAALSSSTAAQAAGMFSNKSRKVSWRQMPSTLDALL